MVEKRTTRSEEAQNIEDSPSTLRHGNETNILTEEQAEKISLIVQKQASS